jgi:hypothetical protein
MYCWSCGTQSSDEARFCAACGAGLQGETDSARRGSGEGARGEGDPAPPGPGAAQEAREGGGAPPPAPPVHWTARSPLQLRSCPSCGFRGEGIPYFRRGTNLALLGAATIFTYGVGGLIYGLVKRNDRICPSCGLGWDRSRPLGESLVLASDGGGAGEGAIPAVRPSGGPASSENRAMSTAGLPSGGGLRRFGGVVLALLALLLVGFGILEGEIGAVLTGGVMGASGALTFGWGWKALQRRRQDLLQRMQRQVIQIARRRGGTLTATDVAADMDLSLPAAERILLSLDDGFRVTSDVTKEGILVFDFREIRLGAGPGQLRS